MEIWEYAELWTVDEIETRITELVGERPEIPQPRTVLVLDTNVWMWCKVG